MGHEMGPNSADRSQSPRPQLILKREPTILSPCSTAVITMRFPLKNSLTLFFRVVIQTGLRILVTFLIFGVCLMITLQYFGIPVPSFNELLHTFDGVSELAKILS